MNQPRKNLAESVLARAELYRRGMMFDGVPKFQPELEMPASPVADADAGAPSPEGAQPAAGGAAPPPVPGAAEALTAGAVSGNTPLETLLQP